MNYDHFIMTYNHFTMDYDHFIMAYNRCKSKLHLLSIELTEH